MLFDVSSLKATLPIYINMNLCYRDKLEEDKEFDVIGDLADLQPVEESEKPSNDEAEQIGW